MTETIWRCDQVRGEEICDRKLFDKKEEAEMFLRKVREVAPDLYWKLEPVQAKMVWN